MTDSPKPRPRPAPHPRPDRPESERPEPEPETQEPRTTRAERRRAERRARSRRGIIVAVISVGLAGGVATYFVVQAQGQPAPRAEASATPTPTPTPTVAAGAGALIAQPDVATAFIAGAVSDIVAVTSYDYRTLDEALSNGLAVTTGTYRESYQSAMTGAVAENARRNHTVQTFDVLRVGIGAITANGTEARVLIFGKEHVTDDTEQTAVDDTPVTLCATIRRQGNSYLISDLVEGANAGVPPGTSELPVAAEAGRAEVVNMLTYRRSDFAIDYARALAGATGGLQRQIVLDAPRTKTAISSGRYDLRGSVTAVAVERATGDTVTLLVAATGTQVDDNGNETQATNGQYEVTVDNMAGSWLTSAITPIVVG
ncbi:MAG: hypothetical protein QOG01_2082 [Pseudonocardiales bacterium]|jgi:hypothetical protein|nr:hypothetical protein [Pseudonocardiales bacterium]